jgi:gamma-glutamyl hydrolase
MGAYVRFMQSAGARVIPIRYDESEEETLEKMSKINGILMPGGGGDYMDKGKFISDQVRRINDAGKFFPLWATCLGFERLAMFTASDPDNVTEKYGASGKSLNIVFTEDPMNTNMFC